MCFRIHDSALITIGDSSRQLYDPIDFKNHPTVVPASDGPKSVHSNQQLAQLVNGPYQGLKRPILKNRSGGKIFHSQLSLGQDTSRSPGVFPLFWGEVDLQKTALGNDSLTHFLLDIPGQ